MIKLVFLGLVSLNVFATETTPFVRIKGGLSSKSATIPFDPSWVIGLTAGNSGPATDLLEDLPSHLPVANFVEVYEYDDESNVEKKSCVDHEQEEAMLKQIGRRAREIVDSSNSDVVLFRNLSKRIQNSKDFATFFEGCLEGPNGWKPMLYMPFGQDRATLDGIDLVTPFPPHMALMGHNEMVYNPRPAGRIAFFCLENAADGGETILTRNADLTDVVSNDVQQFVKDHGGIMYRREYPDGTNADASKAGETKAPSGLPTWQDKTGCTDRSKARKFFTDVGFSPQEVYFDERGALIVENIHSGFIDAPDKMKKYWFNILYIFALDPTCKLADGKMIPPAMLEQLRKDEWKAAHFLKLQPGDWIVINNRVVQHGRLPFVESPGKKRTILTVYTD